MYYYARLILKGEINISKMTALVLLFVMVKDILFLFLHRIE